MASIDPTTTLPSTITDDAKLAVWLGTLMERLYRGKEFAPDEATRQDRCLRSIFTDNDGNVTFQCQMTVILDQEVLSASTGAIWEYAIEIADIAIPASFL
jgi:hypothetical protein